MIKKIFLVAELDKKTEEFERAEHPEYWAKWLAEDLIENNEVVKSIQYRYGAFGQVDNLKREILDA